MFRETSMRSRQGSVDHYDPLSTPAKSRLLPSRRSSISTQLSPARSGLTDTGRLNSFNADNNTDHTRITMKSRITVRGDTPHRFQLVELSDASKRGASSAVNVNAKESTAPLSPQYLLRSPSRNIGHCSTRLHPQTSPSWKYDSGKSQVTQEPLAQNTSDALLTFKLEDLPVSNSVLAVSLREPRSTNLNHSLVEWDLNQQRLKPDNQNIQTMSTTPVKASQRTNTIHDPPQAQEIVDASRHRSHEHTGSQTLHRKARHEKLLPTIPGVSSFNHLERPENVPALESKTSCKMSKALSENFLPVRKESRGRQEAVTPENHDVRSKKRHAIYTQSLYVPSFEQPCYPQGLPWQYSDGRTPGVDPFESYSDRIQTTRRTHPKKHVSFGRELQGFSSAPRDIGMRAIAKPALQDAVEINSKEPSLALERSAQSFEYQPPSIPLRPTRGLNYPRLSRVLPLPEQAEPQPVAYSQIIFQLFADIDQAIAEWKYPM